MAIALALFQWTWIWMQFNKSWNLNHVHYLTTNVKYRAKTKVTPGTSWMQSVHLSSKLLSNWWPCVWCVAHYPSPSLFQLLWSNRPPQSKIRISESSWMVFTCLRREQYWNRTSKNSTSAFVEVGHTIEALFLSFLMFPIPTLHCEYILICGVGMYG